MVDESADPDEVSTDEGSPDAEPSTARSGFRHGFRSWTGALRVMGAVAVLLVLALIAGAVTTVVIVRKPWPQTSGEMEISGLEAEVQVIRDGTGIPHIYADTMHDLMLAQGFVHAQDRFFEMDVRRHATAGRLAELFGADAVESDLVVRTLGWRDVAEQELTMLAPATRTALDAYAEGVNAYLDGRSGSDIALEYTLLGFTGLDYAPEDWSAVDSIAWLKAMAWDLRGNLEEEIGRALTTAAVGPDKAAELYPAYDASAHPPIVRQGGLVGDRFDQNLSQSLGARQRTAARSASALDALAGVRDVLAAAPVLLGSGDGIGSNAWVVDGEKTSTGDPILANDPHLGVSLPGVWHQVGLHCRTVSAECGLDVSGFGFSGVPGVVIGHNRTIAWGFTNLGPDVTDLFVERVTDGTWEYDGEQLPLTRRSEVIEVRDAEPVEIIVRSTKHGPLLSDLVNVDAAYDQVDLTSDGLADQVDEVGGTVDDESEGTEGSEQELAVSLAWTALEPRPTADALLALNLAYDWTSFRAALEDFAVPGQNIVYADTAGHIGYQATGRVPIRAKDNDGTVPSKGWLASTDWTGEYIPYESLPNVLDPARGIITTANQAVIDSRAYAPFLTNDWDQGYRSARIDDLLEADDALSVDQMSAIQLDNWSAIGEMLTPYLLSIKLAPGYYSDGQQLLQTWNYRQGPESGAAAYFNVVWREVLDRTFGDELPEALEPDGSDRWFTVVGRILRSASNPWWDDVETDDVVERRDDILRAAMRAARDEMTALQSPNADEWSWGRLHQLNLRSATLGESGIGPVEWLFNREGFESGGGSSIVNATGWDARDGYEVQTAPSMRMVVPMGDLDDARWINLTGVSGHAFHPHYTDQTEMWAHGETLAWSFSEDAVEAAGEDVLRLLPTE